MSQLANARRSFSILKTRKTISKLLATLVASCLISAPAIAQQQGNNKSTNSKTTKTTQQVDANQATGSSDGDFFSGINSALDDASAFVTDVQSDISSVLSGDFSPLGGEVEQIAEDNFGELGLPDFLGMEEDIDNSSTEALAPISEALGIQSGEEGSVTSLKESLKTSLNANVAKALSNDSALTKEAQAESAKKADLAAEANDTSKELSEEAQNTDVTQHIMQDISQQMAKQQEASTLLLAEAQQSRQADAINNLLSAEALEELNGANASKTRENSSMSESESVVGGQMGVFGTTISE